MQKKTSFTFKLTADQQAVITEILQTGNYELKEVEHTIIAAAQPKCRINVYKSGKCLIQGQDAEDFITFILEPLVIQRAALGYDEIINPEASQPHMGIDESGKGDFFGPLVIAAAYVDDESVKIMDEMGVKDSKRITSDKKALRLAADLRKLLRNKFTLVTIGPTAYNRLYMKMRNVNQMLAWAHARAIENLLESVPDCPMAISDQFGSKSQVIRALMKKGQKIELVQRPKAESDPAVAAASILARGAFLTALAKMSETYSIEFPKGASQAVKNAAEDLVREKEPAILIETAKCHFKTADDVLKNLNTDRSALPPEGQATSKTVNFQKRTRK